MVTTKYISRILLKPNETAINVFETDLRLNIGDEIMLNFHSDNDYLKFQDNNKLTEKFHFMLSLIKNQYNYKEMCNKHLNNKKVFIKEIERTITTNMLVYPFEQTITIDYYIEIVKNIK